MNITIKSDKDIVGMKAAGKLAAKTLDFITPYIQPGVNTETLNTLCHDFIVSRGAIPAPLNYHGFPKSICTSINDVVCHGIPNTDEVLQSGDIINVDVTVIVNGYHGDHSKTFLVGEVNESGKQLVGHTYAAMMAGIKAVKPNKPFSDIGKAIENYIAPLGYGIVRDFTGHGIGTTFHEDPYVLHYATNAKKPIMLPGMTFTIEPMINETKDHRVFIDEADGWTAYTESGARSAQFEHTVLVTKNGCEILTES